MKPYNIPAHDKCQNCGGCCGIIPATKQEIAEIRAYIKKHNITARPPSINCPFRNEEEKKCDIYPVRPLICRLFGVGASPHLQCPNGNSHQIDDTKFFPQKPELPELLNFTDWR